MNAYMQRCRADNDCDGGRRRRARELADKAPLLDSEQIVQLRSVFGNRRGGGAR